MIGLRFSVRFALLCFVYQFLFLNFKESLKFKGLLISSYWAITPESIPENIRLLSESSL